MSKKISFGKFAGDEGGSLVEMAICCLVLMPMMFGVVQFSLAFYAYHFVADAAREASRYAMVRGNLACTNTPNLSQACSTTSGATSDDIQNYVRGLGLPMAGQLTATATWYSYGTDSNGYAVWTSCAGQCSTPGNQVRVTVVDNFALAIPFWKSLRVPIQSTSSMVISQ
jgi:Flp pilus assembly protein TadG